MSFEQRDLAFRVVMNSSLLARLFRVCARVLAVALAGAGLTGAGLAYAGDGVWGPSHGPSPGDVEPHGYVTSLAIDPKKPATVYAAVRSLGVFKSTDAGRHWRAMNSGLPETSTGPYDVRVVAIDPSRPTTLYAGGESAGVSKTTDGGRHWRTVGRAAVGGGVRALAVNPQKPATVYAASYRGVSKTTDGGRTWRPANAGLQLRSEALAIDPVRPETLYVAGSGLVFKSTNGGRNWRRAGTGLVENDLVTATALAIDPRKPETVYVAGYHGVIKTADSGGVFKSTDGGDTWRSLNAGLLGPFGTPSAYALAIDPRRPQIIYAAANSGYMQASDGGVFRSTNGGRTWRPFNRGLTNRRGARNVHALAFDASGRLLYAGTEFGVFDYRFPS